MKVDHIHFQYNGMLLGLLLLSALLMRERRFLLAAAAFAALLHLKHLFALTAPLFTVFLLRAYCFEGAHVHTLCVTTAFPTAMPSSCPPAHRRPPARPPLGAGDLRDARPSRFVPRLASLAAIVLLISAASLGPFLTQLPQLLARLFPFGRGLCHAYWAPNAWALYNTADKLLAAAAKLLRLPVHTPTGYLTRGLVGDGATHAVLPSVRPPHALLAVVAANVPCLAALWRHPRPALFPRALAFCNLCGFMFGWHVHEKAILHATLPLALVCLTRWLGWGGGEGGGGAASPCKRLLLIAPQASNICFQAHCYMYVRVAHRLVGVLYKVVVVFNRLSDHPCSLPPLPQPRAGIGLPLPVHARPLLAAPPLVRGQ